MVLRRLLLGVIVPSSNTVLEPLTQQMVASLGNDELDVTVHFARFRVTKIALSADSNAQFTQDAMLEAAKLLADAHVDVIGWSGTSAAWLGFDSDDSLCAAIEKATGTPATTSMIAMNALLTQKKVVADIGLVCPYTADVDAAIRASYQGIGIDITDERSRCAGLFTNFDFSNVQEPQLDAMVADVVENGATTVLVVCTNLRAAQRAKHWESSHGIQVLDSVATVVVGMMQKLGIRTNAALLDRWGSVFSE